jgi:hypothetical protein
MTLAAFHPRTGFWISLLIAAAGALAVAFLPWETIGAPMLSVLLFGGMAVGLALRDSPAEERRFVIRLLLVALAVRLLAALLFGLALGGGGSYLPSDAVSYDRAAWVMARNWRSPALPPEGLGPLEFIFDDFYPRLLGGLYFLLGHSPAAAVALNGVLGASTVYLVYRIGAMLFGPVVARWAGWLAVFYTGFWFWEMMTLKDALFLFLILLFFLALYRIWGFLVRPDRSGAHLLRAALWGAVLVLIFLAAGEIRVYVPLLLLIAAGLLPVASFLRPDGRGRWILVIGAVAVVLAVFWPKIMSRGLVPVAVNPDSMLFQVTELPATENVGVFLEWVLAHPAGFARYMALAVFSSALAPYAWILPGTLPEVPRFEPGMIAFPGMWMWYLLIPFTLFGTLQAVRRTRGEAWPVVFFAAALFLLFSFFIPRESRHRDMIMPFALLFAAEGLVYSRRWWALGLAVWIPLTGFIAWQLNSIVPILLAGVLAAAGLFVWHIRIRRRMDARLVKER